MVTSTKTETVAYGENTVAVEITESVDLWTAVKNFFGVFEPKMTRITCQSCGYSDLLADNIAGMAAQSHEDECSGTVLYFFQ